MSKKKPGILDDFIDEIKDPELTLQELLSFQAAICINYCIIAMLVPACLAKIPWPLRIIVWAIFVVFWLTIAWAVTIIFDLVIALPNMIIQIIRDEDGDFHDTNGNWKSGARGEISAIITSSFGLALFLGFGRIALCFVALTESFDQETYGNCNPSVST